jgi:hypothetical protein
MSLLVAGDVVYNGVHLYLTESGGVDGIAEWLVALDTAEILNPRDSDRRSQAPGAFDNPSPNPRDAAISDRRRAVAPVVGIGGGVLHPGAFWGAAITLFPPA